MSDRRVSTENVTWAIHDALSKHDPQLIKPVATHQETDDGEGYAWVVYKNGQCFSIHVREEKDEGGPETIDAWQAERDGDNDE